MYSARTVSRVLATSASRALTRHALQRRGLHATCWQNAISKFEMPAMSPTMTEGGIAQWKVKEGDAFSAGDVLLEIETDKATIDVEAQDDGVLGKILAPDSSKNIPVGKVIALLAEEGDDISNLEAPKEEASKASQKPQEKSTPEPSKTTESALQAPTAQPLGHDIHVQHAKPLFPSVQRLLIENGIENADKIKGTGVRGMLTKGDVLAFLGKASSPLGTFKPQKVDTPAPKKAQEEIKVLDGPAIRQLIVTNLLQSSLRARSIPPPAVPYDFESIINDYSPREATPSTSKASPSEKPTPRDSYFDGLL
ncbi:single hybrid motif-containing protein [Fomitiporia mediterranea MF3/22]|uniref:single hybrid motif-containing protein n=1 Tax=Fomitiporia mediterranea (strain MF3/22) TaxID=694068 RepID=UPI0004407B64|nr:single hybrid motif-containing protein [Fomitiporia mediterranea MF3/22]EJD05936.1 single hybrid motif-containing protein [Fomitiporia mediterranea MF3/22]